MFRRLFGRTKSGPAARESQTKGTFASFRQSDAKPDQHEWEIGLASWIIQDGNYPDFKAGQHAQFALEFDLDDKVRFDESKVKSAKPLGGAKYEITGEIVFLTAEVCVVDFGLCAYQEHAFPKGTSIGTFVTAKMDLGVDPFFYFESLYALPGMPPLVYSWRINSIGIQTAPFIKKGNTLYRDESKLDYRTIGKTNAWGDDEGHAEYLLTCTQLDVPPTK